MFNFDKAPLLLVLIVVSAGCVSININHDIKKDGSSDLAFEVQSDYQLMRSSLKQSFQERLYTENAVLSEGENSFTYSFEDVYVNGSMLERAGQDQANSPDLRTEKDSGFIHTTYRVEMDSEGMNLSDLDMGSGLGGSNQGLSPSQDTGSSLTSGIELNYNVDPFGKVVDTNGQELEDGSISFDLTKDKEYYIEFRALSADLFLTRKLGDSPEKPEFNIGEWGECTLNGTQTREVEIESGEESLIAKPPEERDCEYQTQRTASEMLLEESDLEGWRLVSQDINSKTFRKENTTFTHKVTKPDSGTDSYIDSEIERLEDQDYTSGYQTFLEADRTEEMTLDLGSSSSDTSFLSRERQVVLFSKHDVVHRFETEGSAGFTGVGAMEDLDGTAEMALEKTR